MLPTEKEFSAYCENLGIKSTDTVIMYLYNILYFLI